jgi:hypothetical protein
MCSVLYVSGPLDYLLPRIKAVNELQYAEFVWALLIEQVMLDTEFVVCAYSH